MSIYSECWRADEWISPQNERESRLVRVIVDVVLLSRLNISKPAENAITDNSLRKEVAEKVKLVTEMPEDAWLVSIDLDCRYNGVVFVYWSKEFAIVPRGEVIPGRWHCLAVRDQCRM